MENLISSFLYLSSSICFIFALRGLSSPDTARQGNVVAIAGMAIAVVATLLLPNVKLLSLEVYAAVIAGGAVGTYIARNINMTALPQLVAAFHSLVGLAAVFVGLSALMSPQHFSIPTPIPTNVRIEMILGLAIGAITFSGSVVAFAKLQAILPSKPISFNGQHVFNALLALLLLAFTIVFCATQQETAAFIVVLLALTLGVTLIIPIGGADMPVIVSMLNSYSGWAACGIGFTLSNPALIITGALVGASGAILSYIMCKGMNRSIINVVLGGFGSEDVTSDADSDYDKNINKGNAVDAAFMMKNSSSVIIVPGYGMAVAHAQHVLKEISTLLRSLDISVKYAIHPVAGRMPGHMNVLLAEAGVDYDEVFELDEINRSFKDTDVAFVIGANDITNPAAKSDKSSPIYGMPILDVENAKTVFFVKRSLATGYSGVDNLLFYKNNTIMLLDDAKSMCESIINALSDKH